MAINWARGGLFGGGILVGAVLAGLLVGQGGKGERTASLQPPAAAVQQTALATNGRRIDCSFAPIITPASKEDGLLPLDKDLQGNSPSAVATLILAGKESAAAGRPRDAETAFLMACRSAGDVKNDPIPLADAQYQLGRHYAQVAAPPDIPKRAELLKRAEALYASSLQVYLKNRGATHERTRFAQEGLDALQRLTDASTVVAEPNAEERRMADAMKVVGNAPQPSPAVPAPAATPAAPAPAPAAKVAPAPAPAGAQEPPAAVAKAPEPKPARRTSPSFDCSRASSTTEKLICADEDLARQDRELGRLHARAKQAAADPRAFQRESDAEWQNREQSCTDRECLQRWYAKRRAELGAAAKRNEREQAQRAARTERAPAPAVRPAPELAPAPAPRVAAPAPAPAPRVVTPAPRVEAPAPTVRVEPPPAPSAEAPAPLPRDPQPAPATDSMGGPAPTASGGTDIPDE